jgi:hypothetical protein
VVARDDTLDPDALAALEEERDFLLASLDDLDRERQAGDVDDDDYQTLRDDYTHRAAVVLRAIEQRQQARATAATPTSPGRTFATVLGVLAFAALAGLGVARAAGDRSGTEGLTGDIRPTVGQQLFRCDGLRDQFEILLALECYDDLLEEHPGNVEAITNRGWSLVLAGLPELAWPNLETAAVLDPGHSEARAFRAIVLRRWCRPDEALVELDAFDASNPLTEMRLLMEDAGIREDAAALLRVRQGFPEVADPPTPISEVSAEEYDQCPVLADAGVIERVASGE